MKIDLRRVLGRREGNFLNVRTGVVYFCVMVLLVGFGVVVVVVV